VGGGARPRYRTWRLIPSVNETVFEVDQQADVALGDAKIGHQLGLVDREYSLDRLQFEDHLTIHDNVHDIAAILQDIVIANCQRHLAPERHICSGEFMT
jgi:hypothetical protein